MKYMIGYQLSSGEQIPFSQMMEPYWEHVSEVFFPWIDSASGRSAIGTQRGYTDWDAQRRMEQELSVIKRCGIKLDLLMNANCYGGKAISQSLDYRLMSVLDYLQDRVGGVDVITTTSPFIAERVHHRHPEIEVRASVNMWIGTIKAMEYLSDLFDSFYIQREYNRDIQYVQELSRWSHEHEKKIYMLGNSGCLSFCTGHTFHDNLVAHEKEVMETCNVENFEPHTCRRYLRDQQHWPAVMQSSWVRPEDIVHYEGLIDGVKLATRTHRRPGVVISAYARGRFQGNLLDLLEPGYGEVFAPNIIDASRIPKDFFEHVSNCGRQCHLCGYCEEVLRGALISVETMR